MNGDTYDQMTDRELLDLAADRAALRDSRFDIETLPNGDTLASFKQPSPIEDGDAILMSAETALGQRVAVVALLRADDIDRRIR